MALNESNWLENNFNQNGDAKLRAMRMQTTTQWIKSQWLRRHVNVGISKSLYIDFIYVDMRGRCKKFKLLILQ